MTELDRIKARLLLTEDVLSSIMRLNYQISPPWIQTSIDDIARGWDESIAAIEEEQQ